MAEEGNVRESLDDLINQALNSKEPPKKPPTEPIKPQSLVERIVLSKWTAPLSAAAVGALAYLASSPNLPYTDNLQQSAILGGLGYLSAYLLREDWLIRKAEAVRRKTRPLPSKLLNLLPEHPEIISGGVAAYFVVKIVSPMFTSITPSDLFNHPKVVPIALDLSAFLASTIFGIGYPAASLSLGRVLRLETAETFWNASAAAVNAYTGRYKKAEANLAKLMGTQRSYTKAVALQTLIGDLQMLSDNQGSFDTYTRAISTEKTSYVGRSDWVLNPFISFIKNFVIKKAKKPQWTEAADLSYLIAATHAFSEGELESADTLFLTAVNKAREGLPAHVARAAFLRKTGRQAIADLEVQICAEMIMQQPSNEFEVVTEESRNEVFFSGNIALKRNKDRRQLDGEFLLLEKLREEFGQSIIYPLPVYKLSDFYYLLSERGPETLLELMRQRKARFEDFAQAITKLVKIQRFGMKLYDNGELNFDDSILRIDRSKPETLYFANRRRQAIEQIERFNVVKLPESYKNSVINGLAFVDAELAASEILTMYSDRGPKNWLKQLFGQVQALDFEPKSLKLLPPQMDIVNLLEFAEYLMPRHTQRLIELYIDEYEREHRVKVDREEFRRKYEFAGLQWQYERLIYNPEEASKATTPEKQEAKKREQIYHLAKAMEHLDTIVDRQYVSGADLDSALEARRELTHPIFDAAERKRLEAIVDSERKNAIMQEPPPMSKAKLAAVSLAVPSILAAAVFGAIAVKNNLIPFVNVPVFPQRDKVVLVVNEDRSTGGKFKGSDFYLVDAKTDDISFLVNADGIRGASISAFQDKAVFIKNNRIAVYNFRTKELSSVKDYRFENPVLSPDGLWIASNFSRDTSKADSGIWLIRPADMKTRKIASAPNAFEPRWSDNGSYLTFFSNEELEKGSYNNRKVWVNTYIMSSGKTYKGPLITDTGIGAVAQSNNGLLAYATQFKDEKQRIYVSDPKFEKTREVYATSENIFGIEFAGNDHLIIDFFSSRTLLLNLGSLEMTDVKEANFLEAVARDGNRFLYQCGEPYDICEFDIRAGQSRNLTSTPGLREIQAVYSPNEAKAYVVAIPPVICGDGKCPPSLFVIDLSTGKSRLLQQETDGNLRYGLVAP